MQNLRRKFALKTLQISDLILMIACFFLATYETYSEIGRSVSFGDFLYMRVRVINFVTFAVFLLVWHGLFALFGLYRSRRLSHVSNEILDVLKATFVGSVILFALGWLAGISIITPQFIVLFWLASATAIIATRIVLRSGLKAFRLRGRNLRHLLIVGTNRRAVEYARKIDSKPELGYRIVGFVENGWSGNPDFRNSGYLIVTDFEKFPDFIRTQVIDEVMVCLPMKSLYKKSSDIVRLCGEQGVTVRFLSDFFDLVLGRSWRKNWTANR